jgi:hypothetical protein
MRDFEEKISFIFGAIFILFFTGCIQDEIDYSFWQSDEQQTTQRTVSGTLAIADSLLLYESFRMPHAIGLEKNSTDLYIKDNANNEIFIIDAQTLDHKGTISPPEGQGPRELTSLVSYDIYEGNVVINADMNKIQTWNTDGDFIHEFLAEELHPRRIRFRSDEKVVVLSHYFSVTEKTNLLHVINLDGKVEFEFGQVSEDNYSSLKAEGYILTDEEDNVYYSGYSEHILKKWDSEGNQIYSVASIDNHPSEFNYATTEGESQRIMGYSEFANYHSIGMAFLNKYWLILHGGIPAEPTYTPILDIYDRDNGQYLFSMELPYQTSQIVAGYDYLYALHTIEDDIYLVLYDIQQLEDHF